jgi:hypothetical protein
MRIFKRAVLFFPLICALDFLGQSPPSQAAPYGFQDVRLGMSISDFMSKHPAPKAENYGPPPSPSPGQASCFAPPVMGPDSVTTCTYSTSYLSIHLKLSAMFTSGRLALLKVSPPYDSPACFEPPAPGAPNSEQYFYSATCRDYPSMVRIFTESMGPASTIVSPNNSELRAMRWENASSVAEFQTHTCGPWGATRGSGWSEAIAEVLQGNYCQSRDVLSYRQPMMLYIDKAQSPTVQAGLRD